MRAGVRAEFFSFNFTFATKFCFALDLFDMVASFLKLSRTTPTNNPAMFRHIADDVPLALPFFYFVIRISVPLCQSVYYGLWFTS